MPIIKGTRFSDQLAATSTANEEFRGLGGDDTFLFHFDDRSDRFIGGGGNDRLKITYPEDLDRPAPTGLLKDVKFVGGPGFDTIEMALDFDRIDVVLNLNRQGFRPATAEALEVNVAFYPYGGGSPDFTLQGTARADIFHFSAQGGALAGTLRATTGNGNDSVTTGHLSNITAVIVNTGTGNDTVLLQAGAASTHVNTGAGRDVIHTNWLNSERIIAGAGDDIVYLDGQYYGVNPDIVTGGAGRDRFMTDIYQNATTAIITDFRAGQDKIVVTDDTFRPEELIFVETAADIGTDFFNLYFARKEAELYYRGDLVIDLDGAARVGARDFLFEPE